ncbi:hypothetical protein GCM10010289_47980 [Streptomyces violascens]|uniref:Uncharacterized protein n=1 Tax=Streptomyces violascens TaxID=67381 RepID=A0ABQ3QQF9_9ACTN|nr:hypothetical protein GCM10010289_47980 [Streptomyces violascens]GHI39517.1 hypothetical protein Sviol_39250 [Streptomyces violascens]
MRFAAEFAAEAEPEEFAGTEPETLSAEGVGAGTGVGMGSAGISGANEGGRFRIPRGIPSGSSPGCSSPAEFPAGCRVPGRVGPDGPADPGSGQSRF